MYDYLVYWCEVVHLWVLLSRPKTNYSRAMIILSGDLRYKCNIDLQTHNFPSSLPLDIMFHMLGRILGNTSSPGNNWAFSSWLSEFSIKWLWIWENDIAFVEFVENVGSVRSRWLCREFSVQKWSMKSFTKQSSYEDMDTDCGLVNTCKNFHVLICLGLLWRTSHWWLSNATMGLRVFFVSTWCNF